MVKTKLYPLGRTVRFKKCTKKCCPVCENVQNSDTFRSSVTFERFKINNRLTCDDKLLAELFTCKRCSKQYTGETTDPFRLIWNNYKSKDKKCKRGEYGIQENLYEHFCSYNHNGFLEDVIVVPIDKIEGNDYKNRRKLLDEDFENASIRWTQH